LVADHSRISVSDFQTYKHKLMKRIVPSSASIPERMEKHQKRNRVNIGFNHKTTTTMGLLTPLGCKEVYPGEPVSLYSEIKMRFAALYLPIMHQCFFTLDWFYIQMRSLWEDPQVWEQFIIQDPVSGMTTWAYMDYDRADAVFTDGIINYMGFNAPPGAGTLIATTEIGAAPALAYYEIWRNYYRNAQVQANTIVKLVNGDNTTGIQSVLPDLRALRRNWPRDYYTSATPTPQQGDGVLIPSFEMDPETGNYLPQRLFQLDGTDPVAGDPLGVGANFMLDSLPNSNVVLQLSSTIKDFRYAAQFQEWLERSQRAGGDNANYNDYVLRETGYNPNPLFINRPVWLGGSTGDVIIQEVLATAEAGQYTVGEYTGQALARESTPRFNYTCPDYGFIIPILTVYPKASYYSGMERMWRRVTKLDYMWEQFALIGDQPIKNKEVWFSWYDADIAWNDEIFGYVPQYAWERYSNDIVSGQMRTLWESFHLGRKFIAASDVTLNSDFVTCTPDIGRVFIVDAEAGEHEVFVHAFLGVEVDRRIPLNAIPAL